MFELLKITHIVSPLEIIPIRVQVIAPMPPILKFNGTISCIASIFIYSLSTVVCILTLNDKRALQILYSQKIAFLSLMHL